MKPQAANASKQEDYYETATRPGNTFKLYKHTAA